jgi:glycosyltransferase involved in cell wall biosynthesis
MRILFIAYDFPPSPAAGSARIANLTKHLSDIGHKVSVVTIKSKYWSNPLENTEVMKLISEGKIEVIETGFFWTSLDSNLIVSENALTTLAAGMFRQIIRGLGFEIQWPWIMSLNNLKKKLQSQDYDLVLATGNPYVAFYSAKKIAKYLSLPYVLDYRDLWNGNPQHKKFKPIWIREIERNILKSASGISVVSHSMERIFKSKIGIDKPVYSLTNGFDINELNQVKPHKFDQFSIVYAGTFYPPKIVIEPILDALRLLKMKNPELIGDWKFYYWGPAYTYVQEKIIKYELMNVSEINSKISRNEAREKIAGANLSIVISSVFKTGNDADRGFVTSKVFDSLGLRTNVLLISPDDSDVEKIINISKNGKRFSGEDVNGIYEFIKSSMMFENTKPEAPESYSWPKLIQGYSDFLEKCSKNYLTNNHKK